MWLLASRTMHISCVLVDVKSKSPAQPTTRSRSDLSASNSAIATPPPPRPPYPHHVLLAHPGSLKCDCEEPKVLTIPQATAHSVARHPRAAHHKLAERHVAARSTVGAQSKRRSNYQVLTRRDGTKCRVRPAAGGDSSAPAASPSADAPAAPSAEAPSAEAPSAEAPAAEAPSSSAPAADQPAPSVPGDALNAQPSEDAGAASPTWAPEAGATPEPSTSSEGDNWSNLPEVGGEQSAAPQPSAPSGGGQGGGQGSVNGGSANVGSKLGAAWPNGDWSGPDTSSYIGNYVGARTSWYYTWSPSPCAQNDQLGLEFVPMLWGAKQVSEWHQAADSWPSSVKNALFFNEPNQHDQAGISIYDSLGYWINDFLPKSRERGLRIGSAAPTSAPDGVTWVVDFYKNCLSQNNNDDGKCKADFAPVHYYDVDVQHFKDYLTNFHNQVGIPLWVTEYACQNFNGGAQCDEGQTWAFHQEMSSWMDGQDWIERYSPFGMMKNMQGVNQYNALMSEGGDITALGSWYIGNA